MRNVIVKKSKIHGKGVFALRDFKKGETVLEWNLKPLKKSEVAFLPLSKKKRVMHINKKYFLMLSPGRYVNHSCEANSKIKNMSDVAIRNIKKGEEITSRYKKAFAGGINFKCDCKGKKCKQTIIYG